MERSDIRDHRSRISLRSMVQALNLSIN